MAIIFLKELNTEYDVYFAVDESKIEDKKLCNAYYRGRWLEHEGAEDYVLKNKKCTAVQDLKEAISKKFKIHKDHFHLGYEWGGRYSIETKVKFNKESVDKFIEGWRKKNENIAMFKGFSYRERYSDTWQTVIVSKCKYQTHEIVRDKELIETLKEAIENKEFVKDGFEKKHFLYQDWRIIEPIHYSWIQYRLEQVF